MAQPARRASKMRFCEWRGKLFRNLPGRDGRISCLHENSSDARHEKKRLSMSKEAMAQRARRASKMRFMTIECSRSVHSIVLQWRVKHRKDLSCQLLFYHVQCTPDNFIHIIIFILSQASAEQDICFLFRKLCILCIECAVFSSLIG